ncbi:MAG TPA: sigma-70 family RNA polymerase sigma factor [Acidimicrobiales bacterium]
MSTTERVGASTGSARDDDVRRQQRELVERNIPLVEHIVNRCAASMPRSVDRDDLVQVAMVGLIEAARRYDPSRGVAFSTYAGRRIEGAIVDMLRSESWAPRSVLSNRRDMEAAAARLCARLRRAATAAELANELGLDVRQLDQWRSTMARGTLVSLDANRPGLVADNLADDRPSTEDLIVRRDLRERVRACLSSLPERHRYVVVGHVLEERPMHELADQLGVTRSRASQLKSEAIHLLRLAIEARSVPREQMPAAG